MLTVSNHLPYLLSRGDLIFGGAAKETIVFCPTSTKADDEGYLGTVLETGAANYPVQMDDGRLLNVEWDSGYDDWSRGDRVILTTESGRGYMYSESRQTEVDVFPYNPADIGD